MSTKRTRPRRVKAEKWENANRTPWWFLPRTAEAYDAMVEQMAKALADHQDGEWCNDQARDALRAIGITRPKEDTP